MRNMGKSAVQKIAAALLCFLLCAGLVPAALAVEVASAPLSSRAGAQNGMVRVYLSSLGNPSSLTLTAVGNYSVNGDTSKSLSSGETVTVGFSSSTGAITLTRGGVKTNMGTYFALRRHSASGTNGIKIAQGRKPDNPYPGDISFRAVAQSGGGYKLYTIAHIYMENYLYGVLPYEMGNSSHIESLKSQAVAARTYTVRMMQSRSSGYYDVVDTTNDQVYNGTPTGNANCVAAVDATKGIVLMNGSSYTATYYSASNGGQTESIANAWGSGGYSESIVKDDPFDYANPNSVVKRKTVYADCSGSSNSASLMSLLKNKAVSALSSSGYAANSSNTTLKTIRNITPHTPKYAPPSRLYTKMDFTMDVVTQGSVNTSVTVTCNIFTELESMLGMGIQSSSNELWTVQKSGSNFVLEARRYGHGLGLSQRGAMYMGQQGYTYDQILGFYYNGCKRVQVSFTNTILSAASSDPITTVEDPAELGGESGSAGIVKTSGLAVRADKSLSAKVLGVLTGNAPVSVLANDGSWSFVRYGEIKGYVPSASLTITGTPPATTNEAVSTTAGFATVKVTSGTLNLRSSGSFSASVISTAPNGAIMTVFEKGGAWAKVQYGATVAYASADFLVYSDAYPGNDPGESQIPATVDLGDTSATIALRATASASGEVLAMLPHGAAITVTKDDGTWCSVEANGTKGYLPSTAVRYTSGETPGEPSDPSTPGGTEIAATIATPSAMLYSQKDLTSATLLHLLYGQSVTVTEQGSEWCAVRFEGVNGYILTSALSIGGQSGGSSGTGAVVTTQSGSLNLRKEARAGSTILTTIPRGARVTVTQRGDVWSAVQYQGISGYVMSEFLTFDAGSGGTGPTPPPSGGSGTTATVTTQSGSLNLRTEPRAGSAILRTIPQYAAVTVLERGNEWSRVTYLETTGYVMSVFLTFADVPPTTEPTPTPTPTLDPNATPTPTPDPNATPTPTLDPSATPGPSETPTPEDPNDPNDPIVPTPTPGPNTLYAKVTTASGSLNLRRDTLPGSPILARIPKGTTIQVSQKLAAWSMVTYAGQTGYVMNSFLTFMDGPPAPGENDLTATVTTASGSLNLRLEPSQNAGVLARIPQYATVSVQQKGNEWCYVRYGNTLGYVMTSFLTFTGGGSETQTPQTPAPTPSPSLAPGETPPPATPTPTTAPSSQPQTTTARVNTASGSLNLRREAMSGSSVLTTIPKGTVVTITVYGEKWCQLTHNNLTGFVMTQYLAFDNQSSAGNTNGSGSGSSSSGSDLNQTAWVVTDSGALNLRETADSNAKVVAEIPRLAVVLLLRQDSEWSKVRYDGVTGYALNRFLTTTQPTQGNNTQGGSQPVLDPTLKVPETPLFALADPKENEEELALFTECVETSAEIRRIKRGAELKVLLKGDVWSRVSSEEWIGYCLNDYLQFKTEEEMNAHQGA